MINLSNLRKDATPYYLVVDLLMIVLVMINLSWIIFDWLFTVPWVQQILNWIYPPFVQFYGTHVHDNFYNYDLIFVSIFLAEFFFGWFVSIYRKSYASWWHYPFFHWYDLLGCIPVGTFRFLRVLRLISIVVRLHRLGVMDLSNTRLFRFFKYYYDVLVEEVSDRVVVNVLDGVKEEVKHGSPLQHRLINEVLLPRQTYLAEEIVKRVEKSTQGLLQQHQDTVRSYITGVITRSMEVNPELKLIGYVPVVGNVVNRQLDHAVGDIVATVVEELIADLSSDHFRGLIENYTHTLLQDFGDAEAASGQSLDIINDVIHLLQEQVKVQRWKESSPQ